MEASFPEIPFVCITEGEFRYGCRMAEVLVHLLEDMWLGSRSICAPVEVRSTVASLHQQFNNCSQQDAQELLLFLFNAIHDDLKKGQLSYVTLCMRCGHQAHSKQVFNMLSLPVPTDITKCSLQDCLSLFFQQSTLTRADQKLCSECGVKRDTSVLASLDKPPEILILHLKRSSYRGKKKVKVRNVLFSVETLDLSQFLSRPSEHHTTYSLYAVVNHTGQLDMGHYTALCHNPLTHSWHCFDDSTVTEVQDNPVQSQNAYMCLYSRKPFKKPKICGL